MDFFKSISTVDLIPYTGALKDVDLGPHNITAANLSGTNTGDQNLSGLVPYSGAISNVDLGDYEITKYQGTFFNNDLLEYWTSQGHDASCTGTDNIVTIAAGTSYGPVRCHTIASTTLYATNTGAAHTEYVTTGYNNDVAISTSNPADTDYEIAYADVDASGNVTAVHDNRSNFPILKPLGNAPNFSLLGFDDSGSLAYIYEYEDALHFEDKDAVITTGELAWYTRAVKSTGSWVVAASGTYTPAQGIYQCVCNENMTVEINVDGAWYDSYPYVVNGLMYFDGTNMRFNNADTADHTVYYQKF